MSNESNPPEDKKLHIDEDWKAKVEAEKEAARQTSGEGDPQSSAASGQPAGQPGEMPPASLTMLAASLYMQAMISLGLLPNPLAKEGEPQQANLVHARHSIDMLQMLFEKTEGNRTPEETEEIERMLHDLRMGFVSVQQHLGQGDAPSEG